MVWIYLAESLESAWPSQSGSDPSPTVKSTDMLRLSSYLGCQMDESQQHQFGMMLEHLDETTSTCPFTSLLEASPVRISALQELEQAWMESEADFIGKSIGSLANLSPDLSFWKTSLPSLAEAVLKWSSQLPRWGMTVDGQFCQPPQLEPRIKGNGGGYWPTPCASDWKDWNGTKTHGRHSPRLPVLMFHRFQTWPTVLFIERIMNFPSQWTELKPWAMQLYLCKQGRRSRC